MSLLPYVLNEIHPTLPHSTRRYKRPLPPGPNRVAPTTTLEQDWLAAIQSEQQDQDNLRPEHRSAEPGTIHIEHPQNFNIF